MDLFTLITIFVLAIFLGFELISKIPPTLHTPLMSGSNAISGITLVGAVISSGIDDTGFIQVFNMDLGLSSILGFLAVIFATINVVGGFLVTDRMDRMFKKK
ncbi:MAG: NAD(P) transhydrogenase subunit alpha [Spirochaetia bacterium]|nr:NAD(P) transhydrogenase subunit alpha [Spirochaetia bacterium]